MKPLFTRLLLFAGLATFAVSCSKDKDDVAAISWDMDGQHYAFNANVIGLRNDMNGTYAISISAQRELTSQISEMESVGIAISSDKPIVAGRYGVDFDGPGGANDVGGINYLPKGDFWGYWSEPGMTNQTEVIITAISPTSIEGTFKGDISSINPGSSGTTKKTVTNGRFKVALTQ